jgi:nucleoside-diphosphate-sugar epimerase
MTSLQDILLVGATGTLGSAIRKALVANKSKFNRIGVLTSMTSLNDPKKKPVFESIEKDEGLTIITVNLDDVVTLTRALEGFLLPHK